MGEYEHTLKNGTEISNYTIIHVLGAGGFGITYLAKDNKLGIEVVLKEYFPNELAVRKEDSTIISKSSDTQNDFRKGMLRFEEEAKTLAKFNHPSIVKILNYFEANNTAYFVMEYEEGIDLSQYIKQKGTPLGEEEILGIIIPILEGLKEVHANNYLHRDIKPGNILIRTNKPPVLIDFGASKLAMGEASKSITSMLTEGYAPLEQYSTDIKQQGPFTDIYAVAAVVYKMITGNVPPSAQTRSYQLLQDGHDSFIPLETIKLSGFDKSFLHAIDRGLSIKAKDRPQNVQDFQADIAGKLVYLEKEAISTEQHSKRKGLAVAGIISVLIVIFAGYYYVNSDEEKTNLSLIKNMQIDDSKEHDNKVQNELEKQKKLEAEQKKEQERLALEKELKKLKDEKLQAQKEEVARLKREKEERIAKEKEIEEKRKSKRKLAEAKRLKKEQINNYYSNIDTYYNGRFGFSLNYPTNLLTKKTYPTNGDGVWLSNNDGTVEVTPSAAFAFSTPNAKQMYRDALSWKQQNRAIEITYKRQKNNWYVLSGYDHSTDKIFYEKYYLNNGVRSGFSILFPKNEKKKYEKLVDIIAKSFKPSYGEQ